MQRRSFMMLFGSATAATATSVHAQPAQPVIGYLASSSADEPAGRLEAIHLGLKQAGYPVGQKVRFVYRYANNEIDRLPLLASELAALPVDIIITSGGPSTVAAAKSATSTIPIIFAPLSDPVRLGFVESFNRPGRNITGVAALTAELDPKRLELLNELVPGSGVFGVLQNPSRPDSAVQIDAIRRAARSLGRDVAFVHASSTSEIEAAFVKLAPQAPAAVLVAADPLFVSRRKEVVSLMARHRWPAIYQWREFAEVGALSSFGPNLFESYRQVGLFAARVLNGEKPSELPVQQPTRFEFVLNLRTARVLGLAVPIALLSRADEVID